MNNNVELDLRFLRFKKQRRQHLTSKRFPKYHHFSLEFHQIYILPQNSIYFGNPCKIKISHILFAVSCRTQIKLILYTWWVYNSFSKFTKFRTFSKKIKKGLEYNYEEKELLKIILIFTQQNVPSECEIDFKLSPPLPPPQKKIRRIF